MAQIRKKLLLFIVTLSLVPFNLSSLSIQLITPCEKIPQEKRILLSITPDKNEFIHHDSILLSLDSKKLEMKNWNVLEDSKHCYIESFKEYKNGYQRQFTIEIKLENLSSESIANSFLHFSTLSTKKNRTIVEQKVVPIFKENKVEIKPKNPKVTKKESTSAIKKAHDELKIRKPFQKYDRKMPLFSFLFLGILFFGTIVIIAKLLSLIDVLLLVGGWGIYLLSQKLYSPLIAHSISTIIALSLSLWFLFFSWKNKLCRWPIFIQIIGCFFAMLILPFAAQAYLSSGLL
jgi:hypothetical protein